MTEPRWRRLRVVYVIPGFVSDRQEPGLPGIVDLLDRVAAVHDCIVVALRHPPRGPRYRLAAAVVRPLGLAGSRGAFGRARVLAAGVHAVIGEHRRGRADIVHGLFADDAGAVAAIAARMLGRPSVVSVLGGELVGLRDIGYGARLGRGGRWTAAIALRHAALVTVGSRINMQLVGARRDGPVELLPLGVDLDRFRPAGSAPRPSPTLLFAGSLEPVKDPLAAVRVFAELAERRPGLRLAIAGDGSLLGATRSLVEAQGLTGRVVFHGRQPRSAMADLYRSSTALIVTSRHEGQSLVATEAAASGLPVVGTAVGILPELGAGAITVPVGDERALAAALGSVLDEPDRVVGMGRAARTAAERLEVGRTTDAVLSAYARLVRPGSS